MTVCRCRYMVTDQKVRNYPEILATSQYCLGTSGKGGGWGMRFGSAVVAGCIPVRSEVYASGSSMISLSCLHWGKLAVSRSLSIC